MEHPGSWDNDLSRAEFSYNNSYQESLKMALFEVLYRRRCRTPLNWIEQGEKVIFGLEIVDEAEAKVCHILGNADEGHEEGRDEREVSTLIHRTIPIPREMWNHGIQAGVTTVIGRSSQNLPRIIAEEVLEGIHGCCIA
jgi:hypothetical protein